MKSKTKVIGLSIIALLAIIAFIIYPKVIEDLPQDNLNAKLMKFENLMGTQYTEILPVWGNAISGKLTAGVYNTVGLNDPNHTGNTSPNEILSKMDLDQVKNENKALKVIKNGPRMWTVDWVKVNAGQSLPDRYGWRCSHKILPEWRA